MNVVLFPRVIRAVPRLVLLLGLLLIPSMASAVTVTFPIDTNTSIVKLSLDVLGQNDRQNGRLTGTLTVDLDRLPSPSAVSVGDFSIDLAAPIDFAINFGFSGKGTAHVEALNLGRVDAPATPAFAPLVNGIFTATNVSYATSGDGNYKTTGLVCTLVQQSGRPCADTVDFDNTPPAVIDTIDGALTSDGSQMRLQIHYIFVQPLDPANPDFATVTGDATVVALGSLLAIDQVTLTANPTDTGIRIRWSKGPVDLQLFATTDLSAAGSWVAVAEAPVLKSGFYEVNLPGAAKHRFFRLR